MKFYIIFLAFTFYITRCSAQNCACKETVFYPDVVVLNKFKAPDTIVRHYNSYTLEKIYVHDCYGTLRYERYDTLGKPIVKGNLIGEKNSLVKKKVEKYDLNGTLQGTEVIKQYEPKKDGQWQYFDSDGKLIKEEYYQEGKLISAKNY